MSMAFILITADLAHEKDVVQELRRIEGVSEAHLAYGAYDIMVKVQAATQAKVKDIVFSRIRTLDDVRSTLTLVVVE